MCIELDLRISNKTCEIRFRSCDLCLLILMGRELNWKSHKKYIFFDTYISTLLT